MKTFWKESSNKTRVFLIITFAMLILFMQTIYYSDLVVTAAQSVQIWDAIFGKGIWTFYQISGCAYPFPAYLIMGIWNLPFYLLKVIVSLDLTNSYVFMVWNKILLLIFLYESLKVLDSIAVQLGLNHKKRETLLLITITESFLLYSLVMVGQIDVFAILFMLLGINSLLKGDKKKFVLWFAIAITFKMFALIVFIPLVIYSNKKISNMIYSFASSLIPLLFLHKDGIIFRWWKYPNTGTAVLETSLLKRFFSGEQVQAVGNYYVSLFVLLTIILYIYCYYHREEFNKNKIIFISALSIGLFVLFINGHPYWSVLLAPFLTLMIVNNSNDLNLSILLETVGSTVLTLIYMLSGYTWVTAPSAMNNTLLSLIVGENKITMLSENYKTFFDFFGTIGGKMNRGFVIIGGSIVLGCFIWIFFLSSTKCKQRVEMANENDEIQTSFAVLRLLSYFVIGIVPIIILAMNIVF